LRGRQLSRRRLPDLHRGPRLRLVQRGQLHRRARRAGGGLHGDGDGHVRGVQFLAVPLLLLLHQLGRRARGLLPGPRSARHRGRLLGCARRVPGLFVVERGAGQDLHGRHRLDVPRRHRRRRLGGLPDRAAHGGRGRRFRHRVRLRPHPGDRVPHDRTSPLPDDPDPPSLRERRLEGDHGDHPVLAPRGHLLRPGHRAVLRRLARAFGGVTGMTQHQHQHVQGPEIRDLAGVRALVLGAGVSGPGAVRILHALGAQPVVADSRPEALERLRTALPPDVDCEGVDLDRAAELVSAPAERGGVGLVVTSPGWRPDAPLLRAAADSGVAVWGDIELAWRADRAELFGPARTWLAVTGTNGKTTTTSMLEAICLEAGMAARACGNIGLPVTDVLLAEPVSRSWRPNCRASSSTGHRAAARRWGSSSTWPRTIWTGTARWSPTPRPRPGSSPGGWPSPAPTTRSPRDCWPAPRRAPASRSA